MKVPAGSCGCHVIYRTRRNPLVSPLVLILGYELESQNEGFNFAGKQDKKGPDLVQTF